MNRGLADRRLVGQSLVGRRLGWLAGVVAVLVASYVVIFVADLEPRVEGDFFFSTDDPQMQASRRIGELFPSGEQILISATGADLLDPAFLDRLRVFSTELEALPGVASVRSLTHGPTSPQSVATSPLWSRLLLGEDPHRTLIVVSLQGADAAKPAGGDSRGVVERVEEVVARHDRASFALDVSGVPWVVEHIRRALGRDLRVFSFASLAVFALVIALVYRSLWIILGTLVTCIGSCAVTLAVLWWIGSPIGLLTANIVTIVFVLTLSHIVFLTANRPREAEPREADPREVESREAESPEGSPGPDSAAAGSIDSVSRSIRLTLGASIGCAITTFLGFASLLLASAKPLRELGLAGAVGTSVAFVLAYLLYPTFLAASAPRRARRVSGDSPFASDRWLRRWQLSVSIGLACAVAVAAFGLPRLDTDPGLLSYFDSSSELRLGLERIDQSGGSSPLLVVVSDGGARLSTASAQEKMTGLQEAFDDDEEIGSALSLTVLLEEASKVPMAFLLGPDRLIDILDSEQFDHVARSFITEDRQHGLFFLRMREATRHEARRQVIERQLDRVRSAGLEVDSVGGLYQLQASLGELVASSLTRGLSGLLLLFVVVAGWAARKARVTAAMILCLAAVPVLVLGLFGHLGQPLDIISSPAANVAIALGIDSMIHLVMAVRRRRLAGDDDETAWAAARAHLWPAIFGAAAILAAGFGIFSLSSFPPTRRFGVAVAAGTVVAAVLAVLVLPLLAGARRRA